MEEKLNLEGPSPLSGDNGVRTQHLSNVQLSDEVYERLEELAKKENITVSELVSKILKDAYNI